MFSEILQSKNKIPEDERKEYLEIIEGESERLSKLIQNVLDFSKIERGSIHYNFTNCDLNNIIHEVIRSVKYQLDQNKFKVKLILPEEPVEIIADSDAIKMVLFNLISNAIKYSDTEKYLSIELSVENQEYLDNAIFYQRKAVYELAENDDLFEYIYYLDKSYDEYKKIILD